MALDRQFHSLEDFLASTMIDVDGVLDNGGGVGFPVKGREIEATVLFSDISADFHATGSGQGGQLIWVRPLTKNARSAS